MQYATTISDSSVLAIAAARAAYNAGIPATVTNDAGEELANPALADSDSAYLDFVFLRAIQSWRAHYTPEVPDTVSVAGVPQFIKKWQLWAGLRIDDPSLTLYNAVKAYTDSFTGMKRDLWLDSTGIERAATAIEDFKALFHKSDADIDGMFTRYAAITLAQASALE